MFIYGYGDISRSLSNKISRNQLVYASNSFSFFKKPYFQFIQHWLTVLIQVFFSLLLLSATISPASITNRNAANALQRYGFDSFVEMKLLPQHSCCELLAINMGCTGSFPIYWGDYNDHKLICIYIEMPLTCLNKNLLKQS
ncbi:hypothetical protein GQX74_007514 [Glossina fuscipes]|nr:hypothetical protein GQX74_007514 [Glossina fuscipes]